MIMVLTLKLVQKELQKLMVARFNFGRDWIYN